MGYTVLCRMCPSEDGVHVPVEDAAQHIKDHHPEYFSAPQEGQP